MFGIKMPWTRRKERLAKEAAAAAVLVEQAERKAQIERAVKELKRRVRLDAEWFAAKAKIYNPAIPYEPCTLSYIRHDTIDGRARFIATESFDNFSIMAAAQIATISTLDDTPAYCPSVTVSSYTPSYESPSCSYSGGSDYSSSSNDSSSSSSSSYD
jgi:hypothetical protein